MQIQGKKPLKTTSQSVTVEIANEQSALEVEPLLIQRAVSVVLSAEYDGEATIAVALVDDAMIHRLNRQFLDHDWPTDVLSFPLEEDVGHLEAELVVSTDTAIAQANNYGWTAQEELLLYVIHGTLHLAGHDDQSESDCATMRKLEQRYLEIIGIDARGAVEHGDRTLGQELADTTNSGTVGDSKR